MVLSELILPNDTVPIITIVSSTSDSEAEPLEQLDGLLNTEQILNLDKNDWGLRAAVPVDVSDGGVGADSVDVVEDMGGLHLAIPNHTGLTLSLSSPRVWYVGQSHFGQITMCLCESFKLLDLCDCNPRIQDLTKLGQAPKTK